MLLASSGNLIGVVGILPGVAKGGRYTNEIKSGGDA